MNNVARLSREDRRELWSRAAERLPPLPDLMIEKDFWVCFTLQHLFALPGARDHFIFKGGTSLSKVWRAIHRFSEDIDISLSREWLGFGGDRDPEAAGTRKQRAKQLAALSEACGERLREEIAPALSEALAQVLGRTGWNLEVDPEDEQTLLFTYPTALGEITGRAYIRPVVRIECGARSDRWPVSSGHVTPYVAEAFPDTLPNAGVDIPVLDIERTFWEKASILSRRRPPSGGQACSGALLTALFRCGRPGKKRQCGTRLGARRFARPRRRAQAGVLPGSLGGNRNCGSRHFPPFAAEGARRRNRTRLRVDARNVLSRTDVVGGNS